MRVAVHDFSGHPFQAELARSLAGRGYEVLHVQCTSYSSGKGSFGGDGGTNPQYVSLSVGSTFARYSPLRRLVQELRYGRSFAKVAKRFRPDLVLSCNDPLIAKATFGAWAKARRLPWVFWLQDLYSVAMTREAERRTPAARRLGEGMQRVERWLLQESDAVVSITDDFAPTLEAWDVPADKCTVIENWAPLAEVPLRPRDNPWRASVGLPDRFTYLYAGTLGLKHNPDVLHALAVAQPDAEVVVVSEGLGAARLQELLQRHPVPNLRVLPFQPWETLPDMLGAADVLVVLLEAEAGVFSVPSKILTSLCAGRPVLAAMPAANLGARTIQRAGAGLIVAPGDLDGFCAAARQLHDDEALREKMGRAARAHAEREFDIEVITDRFVAVIEAAAGRTSGRVR